MIVPLPPQGFVFSDYELRRAEVPMRDGVTLHTVVATPREAREFLPILMTRTPYDAEGMKVAFTGAYDKQTPPIFREGYTFVFQDVRGRFRSKGTFVSLRPMRKDDGGVDEATDAKDTIDWLLKNVPNHNGRVGMFGLSYPGWTTLVAAADPHPALRAASPQAACIDQFVNDDFHRNGAFRLSYGFEMMFQMESNRSMRPFDFKKEDTYDWYLRLGPLSNANRKYLHGKVPTWNAFIAHPNHDAYWKAQSVANRLTRTRVPTLHVGGFWDQEDPWGPQEGYRLMERADPNGWNHLALGPWNHGGWQGKGDRLAGVRFGSDTGTAYQRDVEVPFFAHYLKDKGRPPAPVTTFQTGTNRWQRDEAWPPKDAKPTKLYLAGGGRILPRQVGRGSDAFVSDPAKPVPYRPRPISPTYAEGSGWYDWQAYDQRFLKGRPDVLTYRTAPLAGDLTMKGRVRANLVASTTGTDADWVVKVIDEGPNGGYRLPIAMEVVRARFRDGLDRPRPVPAGKPVPYTIDLHSANHVFRKGHRLVVQVQSTWFPVIDRNPQTFVANPYLAKASDYRRATHRVFHEAGRASCLTFDSPAP